MWRTHPWTLAHFTGASVLHASLAWPRPSNSTGPGTEHLLTTRYMGTGSRAQLAAHPAGLHTPRAGISPPQRGPDRGQHLLLSEGVRRPSSPAPTPPGLSSKVCLGPIIEQDTQEVKQGPDPRPRVNRDRKGGLGEQAPFSSPGVSLHHKNQSLG